MQLGRHLLQAQECPMYVWEELGGDHHYRIGVLPRQQAANSGIPDQTPAETRLQWLSRSASML